MKSFNIMIFRNNLIYRFIAVFLFLFTIQSPANVVVDFEHNSSPETVYTVHLLKYHLTKLTGHANPNDISVHLVLDPSLAESCGDEGYQLHISPADINIKASTEAGLLYGSVALVEWAIANSSDFDDYQHADIDFPVVAGQAAELFENLPEIQLKSKPFYPLRFFELSNFSMGVADLIDTEVLAEKNNYYSGHEGGFKDAAHTWKTWCDWCSRHRINRLSNWPYSTGTNWWDLAVDPATKGMSQFSNNEIIKAAKVREDLFKYASSRGVKPYLMNYLTGSATTTIAQNRPDLVGVLSNDEHHNGAMSFCHADGRLTKVFTAQIRAILRTYPSLAGIHIRWWGESFPCQCDNCRGRQGELQKKLTLEIIEAAIDERPDIEILLSGRLFLHGSQEFWDKLPDNVILQTKWGRDWEPTAEPNLDFEEIRKTGQRFLISQALPSEEVSPFGNVQYLPYQDGVKKYAASDKAPNINGFSIVSAEKDFGWITETNFLAMAKLNWAPLQTHVEDLIGNYLESTYGDASEAIYKSLELNQNAWKEFCVDFDGITLYKDYYRLAWMFGLDSLKTAKPEELARNIKRIEKHSQMMAQALFLLESNRNHVTPTALPAFNDMVHGTQLFTEFFTSRLLLAEAFSHKHRQETEKMRKKLGLVLESDKRLVKLALSKPNIADDFEMEGMVSATNFFRDTIYMKTGAWDFLHNRVFNEMDEIEKMIQQLEN